MFPLRKGNSLEGLPSCPFFLLRKRLHFITPPSKPPLGHTTRVTALGWHWPQIPLCEGPPLCPPPLCLACLGMLVVPKDSGQQSHLCLPCAFPRPSPFPQPCQFQLGVGQCRVLSGCLRAASTAGVLLGGAPPVCHPPGCPGSNAYLWAQSHGVISTFPSPQ